MVQHFVERFCAIFATFPTVHLHSLIESVYVQMDIHWLFWLIVSFID